MLESSASSASNASLSKQLEAIVVADTDFHLLEQSFGAFCPFEALGAVYAELRHGAFLASMLDPFRPHGYGSRLLRAFLITAVRAGIDAGLNVSGLTPLNVHLLDLDDAEIRREWQAIDLVVVLPLAKIVIAIELKIDATQGPEQLSRYRKTVNRTWANPNWRRVLIFLTKNAEPPDDDAWIPVELSEIADAFESAAEVPGADPSARNLLKAYLSMLRRHHMENEDLSALAQRLWSRHPEALKFLMDHRPDALGPLFESYHENAKQIAARLTAACQTPIEVDSKTRAYIHFAVSAWDTLPDFRKGEGWTASHRFILFELSRSQTEVKISVILGPGPDEIRKRMFQAIQNSDIRTPGALAKKYKWLKSLSLMKLTEVDTVEIEDQREVILGHLENFFREVVPKLGKALTSLSSDTGMP
jgi:PD-(D/E)XK nuclease superfamily